MAVPTPKELSDWEKHPVTLALSQKFAQVWLDAYTHAQNESELAEARGFDRAFRLVDMLREEVNKEPPRDESEMNEEEGEESGD